MGAAGRCARAKERQNAKFRNWIDGNIDIRDFDFVATFGDCSPGDYAKRYFGLLHELEDTLGAPVDLLTPDSIHRRSLRERIEKDSLCLFES